MEPATWALLGLLGAWAALDGSAAGQFMISRPLVTGTLAGALLGDPRTGFQVGLLLEIAHLGAVPIGGARVPEPGPAAIPGTAVAVLVGGGAGIALGVATGMILSVVGGASMLVQRRVNGRITHGLEEGLVSPRGLGSRLLAALALEGARGAGLTLGGLLLVWALAPWLAAAWPLEETGSWVVLLVLLAYPAGVLAWGLGARWKRLGLLLAGGIAGILLGIWVQGG